MSVNSGAYRVVSVEEWRALGGNSNDICDWHEGIGYVVYDDLARDQYRAKMEAGRSSARLDLKRNTFEVPAGFEAVRDESGRATGSIRLLSKSSEQDCEDAVAWRFRWVYPATGEPTAWVETHDARIARQKQVEGWDVRPLFERPVVTAKPLEWVETANRRPPLSGHEVVRVWEAATVIGSWATIVECSDGRFTLLCPESGRFDSFIECAEVADRIWSKTLLSLLACSSSDVANIAPSAEVRSYMAGVSGIVEANNFEIMSLREKWENCGHSWDSTGHGYMPTVGAVGSAPICISIQTALIEGQKILFIDPTSMVVDHDQIESWLKTHVPTALRDDGCLNKTDASNFPIVIRGHANSNVLRGEGT